MCEGPPGGAGPRVTQSRQHEATNSGRWGTQLGRNLVARRHGVVNYRDTTRNAMARTELISAVAGFLNIQRHRKASLRADCKSVGLRLRRFESCTCHPGQRHFRAAPICRSGVEMAEVALTLPSRQPSAAHRRCRIRAELRDQGAVENDPLKQAAFSVGYTRRAVPSNPTRQKVLVRLPFWAEPLVTGHLRPIDARTQNVRLRPPRARW